jgi:hypothetical protein
VLKGGQLLAERNNVQVDVGRVKRVEEYLETAVNGESGGEGEGPQPIDVASRLVAHLIHRTPGVRKLGKKFEGRDLKSGIGTDFLMLIAQLGAKNEDMIRDAAGNVVSEMFDNGPGNGNGNGHAIVVRPSDGVHSSHVDFGPVAPADEVQDDQNNGGNEDA